MRRVLITFSNREYDPCNEGIAHRMLAEHGFEITQYEDPVQVFMPSGEINAIGQDYDAVITMGIPIGDDFLMRTTPRLKIIARYGSGYDEIEAELARKYGVAVTISKEIEHTNRVRVLAGGL